MKAFEGSSVSPVRAGWRRFALRRAAFLWIPPGKWPLRWHAALALGSLALVLAACATWHQVQRARHAQALAAARQADALVAAAQQHARNMPKEMAPPMAAPLAVDQVMRDVAEFGATRGIRLSSVKIEHDPGHDSSITQVKFVAQVSGDYGGIKAWLGDLLGRHPALAIASLSIRRVASDAAPLDGAVSLSLFVKAGQ